MGEAEDPVAEPVGANVERAMGESVAIEAESPAVGVGVGSEAEEMDREKHHETWEEADVISVSSGGTWSFGVPHTCCRS